MNDDDKETNWFNEIILSNPSDFRKYTHFLSENGEDSLEKFYKPIPKFKMAIELTPQY